MSFKVLAYSLVDKIDLDENHNYLWSKGGIVYKIVNQSVTGIISPGGVPRLKHIVDAGNYGTRAHKYAQDMLLGVDLGEVDDDDLSSISALAMFNHLHEFLANCRPENMCKNPRTVLTPCFSTEEKYICAWYDKNGGEHLFGGSIDVVVDLVPSYSGLKYRIAVEFKTTKSCKETKHLYQISAYMKMCGANVGLIIYDDPGVRPILVTKDEAENYVENVFDSKCADAFLQPFITNDEIAKKIEAYAREIQELSAKSNELRRLRDSLVEEAFKNNEELNNYFKNYGKVAFGNCVASAITSKRTNIDTNLLKSKFKKIYEQVATDKITTYTTFNFKNHSEVENG